MVGSPVVLPVLCGVVMLMFCRLEAVMVDRPPRVVGMADRAAAGSALIVARFPVVMVCNPVAIVGRLWIPPVVMVERPLVSILVRPLAEMVGRLPWPPVLLPVVPPWPRECACSGGPECE